MPSQTATIMVTDLVGSTELRSRLGEEAADWLHRLHDRLLRDAVEAHGGGVIKGLGDGVLASFAGAAEAVAAAVAVQQAANFHSRRHPDQALVVRIGLSAGDVTIEEDGDHVGTPVVEAARLCASAQGGQILAADIVRALTRGRGGHQFTPAGELELKGLPEPVEAVEIGWQGLRSVGAEIPFPPLLAVGDDLGFAGREAELELLASAWKEACAGSRRVVLIGGEPGVGKTRLSAELARRAHNGGGAILYGRCEEDLGAPYEPFVEALRWFCEHIPAHELPARLGRFPGELARLAPELPRLVPGLEPPLRSDPETEQYRFFEAVASWLASAGDPGGLLLVVDDLHWAPPPTISLLAHVLRAGGPAPLLVLATFRDTDIGHDHPLAPVLAALRRTPGIERLALGGLSVEELAQLLERTRAAATPAAAASLHEATEGNPFFVSELLRHVTESDVTADVLPVPEGVREVIVARVARLSPACRELLGVASVLGRSADLVPLARVAGVGEDAAVEALDEALGAHLIEETAAGAYRFVHALVRSALYDSLSASRRGRLHLRAADVCEGGEDPARLAHHLVAATSLSPRSRTGAACLAAGDRALTVLADTEAAAWYRKGFDAIEGEEKPGLVIDLLTGLGEAQRRTGDAAFRETLLDASRRAAGQSDPARLARAVLANNRGLPSTVGQVDEERIELIETALELVGPAPSGQRAELLALFASELSFGDDHDRRLSVADEAAAIAARLDDVTVRARVGGSLLFSSVAPDRFLALAAEGVEAVRLADASGDPQLRVLNRARWVLSLQHAGQLSQAHRATSEAVAIVEETGQPGLRCIAQIFHAGAIDALGEHAEASRLAQASAELGQEAGYSDALQWYGAHMHLHWDCQGQPDIAAAVAALAFAQHPRLVTWHGTWLLALALGGRNEELAEVCPRLPDILATVPNDAFWVFAHFQFGVAMGFGVHDRAAAGIVYDRLLPHRRLHAAYGAGYWGPVDIALGVTARVLGDADGALEHHEAAATAIEECGAARARALNGYLWAMALLNRGDRQRATELMEETLTYSREKGYVTFERLAEQALA